MRLYQRHPAERRLREGARRTTFGDMDIDRDRLRATLDALRDTLAIGAETGAADRAPVELDQTSVGRLSRIDAMQMQAMALATEQRRQAELARVLAALARLGTEEFRYCEICGEAIAPARLGHNPAVTTCIGCAR